MSKKFFRALYVPELVKTGDRRAINIAKTDKARSARRVKVSSKNFKNISAEERRAFGARGGTNRWANLSPEERRIQELLQASRMRASMTPAQRREYASRAGKAQWEGMSPEQKAQRIEQAREAFVKRNIGRRTPRWPFPEGPKWQPLTGEAFVKSMRERREAKARLRKFQGNERKKP